ncbi:GNAT family N-acetyltransferase [Yoonia sp. 208BN28-4]|uniref:GNAT family N-acetyltransferase n=1 Tax=Yoonia sp. 208BN28-4 TaxID=3126505 RepID=UPI0030A514D7
MSDPAIRRATADDAPACADILNGWIDSTDWMPRMIEADALEPLLRKGLPMREAYVIGDPVAGYLSVEAENAHIWGFYVGPKGQGFGRALLDHVKDGRDYLRLNSHAANTQAHAFYKREGFVQAGAPWLGDDGIDEIRMEWRR